MSEKLLKTYERLNTPIFFRRHNVDRILKNSIENLILNIFLIRLITSSTKEEKYL